MIYNEKYKVYVNKDGVCLKYVRSRDRLEYTCCVASSGYLMCSHKYVHRIIWETFNGEIPDGYVIDHIDCDKLNNSLSNLQLVTQSENCKLAYKRGNRKTGTTTGKTWSVFGSKFKNHYKINMSENKSLYKREKRFYDKHGYCSWET